MSTLDPHAVILPRGPNLRYFSIMARSQASNHEFAELRSSVLTWASRNRTLEDPYVKGLLRALNSPEELDYWATLKAVEHLPEEMALEPNPKFIRHVELVRNTLVFVPIALTWMSIGKSSDAFTKYIAQNSGSVVNFLQFWQNGYGYLSSLWRLGSIATIDALIMFTLIILTVFTQSTKNRLIHKRNLLNQDYYAKRMDMAFLIDEFFYHKRNPTALTISKDMKVIMGKISQATVLLEKTTKELYGITKKPTVNRDLLNLLKQILHLQKSLNK